MRPPKSISRRFSNVHTFTHSRVSLGTSWMPIRYAHVSCAIRSRSFFDREIGLSAHAHILTDRIWHGQMHELTCDKPSTGMAQTRRRTNTDTIPHWRHTDTFGGIVSTKRCVITTFTWIVFKVVYDVRRTRERFLNGFGWWWQRANYVTFRMLMSCRVCVWRTFVMIMLARAESDVENRVCVLLVWRQLIEWSGVTALSCGWLLATSFSAKVYSRMSSCIAQTQRHTIVRGFAAYNVQELVVIRTRIEFASKCVC